MIGDRISEHRKRKLEIIKQILEDKERSLAEPPRLEWYGDTFDRLYDSSMTTLNSQLRVINWINK